MEFFSSNDYELSYNETSAHAAINKLYDLLNRLERKRVYMIDDVEDLELHAHDVENTEIDQDYMDFESVLNEDGLINYENEIKNLLDRIETAMYEYERVTRENYERREEERRRQEEQEQEESNGFTPFVWHW